MHKMCFLFMLLASTFFAISEQNLEQGFCDKSIKVCADSFDVEEQKYILYDVNSPEGFNLRRDVYMRFAIMIADAKKKGIRTNWSLVLPPWHRLYHWKVFDDQPIPWSKYFDIDSLKTYAPVVDLHEIIENKKFFIDILYVLQNYDDPFEGGTFIDKWEIDTNNCYYDGSYWGHKNINAKEIICVKFQGHISKLWELVFLHQHAKMVMFAHGEIPLHNSYGTKTFWDCRKSMKFNKRLVNAASHFITTSLDCKEEKCTNYLSIHWRRQDFARGRKNEVPSITGTAKQIDQLIKKKLPKIKKIFVASDAIEIELNKLENQLNDLGYKVYSYKPSKEDIKEYGDGGVAIIDQIICSHALYFVGTHESTFSYRIQEEREILGFDSKTTFNRLCPDSGVCDEPSKWTIIN